MNSNRKLTPLWDALGADPTGMQPALAGESVVPTYQLQDLQFSIPYRGSVSVYMNCTPTIAVAQFSAVEIAGVYGVWIRRAMNTGGNCVFGVIPFAGTGLAVTDPVPLCTIINPEGADRPSVSTVTPTSSVTLGSGLQQFPALFSVMNMGRSGVLLNGVFMPASAVRDGVTDLWIPPGIAAVFCATAANTNISWNFDLDFPAQCYINPLGI